MTASSAEVAPAGTLKTLRVEIQQECRPRDAGSFINTAVNLPGSRRGAPVNAIQRVALLIRPDAREPGRIFKQPMRHADLTQRPARSQIVALQRQNFGQHQGKMRFTRNAKSPMQTEYIARFQQHWSQLIIAAHEKGDVVT